MIKTIVYDVNEGSIFNPLAILNFSGCGFPQFGDNIVINEQRYVVQRKEYIVDQDRYDVCLQVKKYIPDEFGF